MGTYKAKISDMPRYSDYLAEQLQDPEFAAEYAKAKIEVNFAVALAMAREKRQLSQSELAAAMNVKQPAVAKLESGGNDPRLTTIHALASKLGAEVIINADGVKVRLPRRRAIVKVS
jgi:ribosome-binding protein aMBF1 (putative translation factor)